jgi:thiamine-phosphate pyrophosphorylase
MLQFITNSPTVDGTVQQAFQALEGGCDWVQVRMKDAADADVEAAVCAVLPMCNSMGAKLIIDDRVDLVARTGAHGVHLGQHDMSPTESRKRLGTEKIIGFTVNNINHAERAVHEPIDYIGMGPWRFTATKQKLAPVLGAEGVTELIAYLRRAGVDVPVVAIGGITVDDIPAVVAAGANGVAVSGEIAHAANPTLQTKLFVETLKLNSK